MLKIIAAGATALALVAGASAYAQESSVGPDFGRRQQFGAEDGRWDARGHRPLA